MSRAQAFSAFLLVVAIGGWVIAQENIPELGGAIVQQDPATTTRHYSYAIGLEIGRNFKTQANDLDLEQLVAGVKDGLGGAQPRFNEQTLQAAMQELGRMQMSAHARKNKQYLERNRQAEGVKVFPSGLQYKVLKQGTGPKPTLKDTVQAHYTGRLIDGTVFDSSVERGQPFTTKLTEVIPGWTEALKNMNVGSKWLIVVPSDLAYGERGMGPIPPQATLIFEMELLGIQ